MGVLDNAQDVYNAGLLGFVECSGLRILEEGVARHLELCYGRIARRRTTKYKRLTAGCLAYCPITIPSFLFSFVLIMPSSRRHVGLAY